MAESINRRARRIIDRRNEERKEILEQRRKEIFRRFPRIEEIEMTMDATGMRLLREVAENVIDSDEAVRRIMLENRTANIEKKEILHNGGFPEDYIDEKPLCSLCSDTGYVDGKLCRCVKAELNRELAVEANLTQGLSAQTFEKFRFDYYSPVKNSEIDISPLENIHAVYETCKSFAENFETTDKNLFLTGECGVGKTYLSSAIANRLIDKGVDVLYISANTLFPLLEDLHFNRNVSAKSQYLVEHVLDAQLLILDDLGAEFTTPFTSAELFRIINNRLVNERKMVISTNLGLNEIGKRYSERIYSRVVGYFEVLRILGEDIRKQKKNRGE